MKQVLELYCASQGWTFEVVPGLGSGMGAHAGRSAFLRQDRVGDGIATADRWFVSITVDTDDPPRRPAQNEGAVGVDLGVLALATLSTGERIPGPKACPACGPFMTGTSTQRGIWLHTP